MLPPYPRLVTELPHLVINQPPNRSEAAYVKAILQLPVTDPRYQRDKYGTKCNFYVHDCLHLMGYPVQYRLARQYIEDWHNKDSPLQRMVIQDAITNANMGCPTVAALLEPEGRSSHVMMVLPQEPVTEPGKVIISNVGASNFYGRQMYYAVPAKRCHEVMFFGAP